MVRTVSSGVFDRCVVLFLLEVFWAEISESRVQASVVVAVDEARQVLSDVLVALNDKELIGRTRLQKTIYLLDRCGADFGLPFEYYRYGPYSFELVGGLNDALADERIDVEERPGRHKVRYAVFRTDAERPEALGNLLAEQAVSLLGRMKYVSDFVLELAATIVFLRDEWHYYGKNKVATADAMDAAVEETKRRKSLKATPERLEKALALLDDLGLADAPAGQK